MPRASRLLRLLRLHVLVALACLGVAGYSDVLSQMNGCGTGWNSYLVPDRIVLPQCEFRTACDSHDVCYGRCASQVASNRAPHCEYLRCTSAGDLVGSAECRSDRYKDLRDQANNRKRRCDSGFYSDIVTLNNEKPVCRAFATIYSRAVRWFGESAFAGMDGFPGVGLTDKQAARSSDAIAEALRTLGPEELNALSDDISGRRSQIDWSKELVFNKDIRRLENRK